MQVRNLANMATYQTQQQSIDVKEGHERRVRQGLFPQKPPYGYENYHINGRSLIRTNNEHATNIRRIFELYAFHCETLDSIVKRMYQESYFYLPDQPTFVRSKIETILKDPSYLGWIRYNGRLWEGTHERLIDQGTWDRVQALLGHKHYQSHELLYAGELIRCGHCEHIITGENIKKKLKSGEIRKHIYYRCSRYTNSGHPKTRLQEKEIDRQILDHFHRMQIDDESIKKWFVDVIRAKSQGEQKLAMDEIDKLTRLQNEIRKKQSRLLDLRLSGKIEEDQFEEKNQELRDQEANLSIQLADLDQNRHENADIAVKSFELSQNLIEKWDTADFIVKRRILEILCLNLTLNDTNLVITWRKPFDVIAKGLKMETNRGDRI